LLEHARKITRACRVYLYEVFCAVLYLLRSSCQWQALPSELPKRRTVHTDWVIWIEPHEGGSLLAQALKKSAWRRGPKETGSQRLQRVLDRGCAAHEEHGYDEAQGR